MKASQEQLSAMLGNLVTHQSQFREMSVADSQWAFKNPKDAIELFKKVIQDHRRQRIIPTSRVTNSSHDFEFMSGGYSSVKQMYENSPLADPEVVNFDHMTLDMIFNSNVIKHVEKAFHSRIPLKVVKLGDFGFDQGEVETSVFMNNEFLEAWSKKHYHGFILSLCEDTDFLYFTKHGVCHKGECVIPKRDGYIFAMEPKHHPSGARCVFAVHMCNEKFLRNVSCIAAHSDRKFGPLSEFMFRIKEVPIEEK